MSQLNSDESLLDCDYQPLSADWLMHHATKDTFVFGKETCEGTRKAWIEANITRATWTDQLLELQLIDFAPTEGQKSENDGGDIQGGTEKGSKISWNK